MCTDILYYDISLKIVIEIMNTPWFAFNFEPKGFLLYENIKNNFRHILLR